jgi:hypothetical protein
MKKGWTPCKHFEECIGWCPKCLDELWKAGSWPSPSEAAYDTGYSEGMHAQAILDDTDMPHVEPVLDYKVGDKIIIVDGERRWLAQVLSRLDDVPSFIGVATGANQGPKVEEKK